MLIHKQAQVHLRGGNADHDGSASSTSEARKRQHCARSGRVSLDERGNKLAIFAVERFGRLGVEGSSFLDQLEANVVGGRETGRNHGEERNCEGNPASNRLGDCTGRHFAEGVPFQALTSRSPRS